MAGYAAIYCIGSEGGAFGSDGINPIGVQLWVGVSDRMWIEAHYFVPLNEPSAEHTFKSRGQIRTMVPGNFKDAILDACILFVPDAFKGCPTMTAVQEFLNREGVAHIDFDQKRHVPPQWNKLREEARQPFSDLCIYGGPIEKCAPDDPILSFSWLTSNSLEDSEVTTREGLSGIEKNSNG